MSCTSLPCCQGGSYYEYLLTNGPLYGNPLVPIPGGKITITPIPNGVPGMVMTITSSCCDGSGKTEEILIPKENFSQTIKLNCCNGKVAARVVTPSMTAAQVQALGLAMAIECTFSNDCGGTTGGPGGPFSVSITCCDGSVEVGQVTPDMDTTAINNLAAALVAACEAKVANCTSPPNPDDPNDHPNPDVYYPGFKVGNDPQVLTLCTDSTELTANTTLPGWVAISGNDLIILANQFFAIPASLLPSDISAAKSQANTSAQNFLANWAIAALADSTISCDSVVPPPPCDLWEPSLLAGKLRNWFNSTTITGKVDGDTMLTWTDDGYAGWDGGGIVANVENPIYRTNAINSLPVVSFAEVGTGTNSFFRLSGVADFMYSLNQILVCMVVWPKAISAVGGRSLFTALPAFPLTGNWYNLNYGGTPGPWRHDGKRLSTDVTQFPPDATSHASTLRIDLLTSQMRFVDALAKLSVNGTVESTEPAFQTAGQTDATGGDASFPPQIAANGSPGFKGYMAEIMVAVGHLTSIDIALLEGYAAWKWGIEAQLPIGHTYRTAAPIAKKWQIQDWAGVLAQLDGMGTCNASAFPEWGGLFNILTGWIDGVNTYPLYCFIEQAIGGFAAAADDITLFPDGNWQSATNFTQLYWNGAGWYLQIACEAGTVIWGGASDTANIDDPTGTYTKDQGDSTGPPTIDIAAGCV